MHSGSAIASIQSANDPVFGSDSITQDTSTGLEWLDVTASRNLSFNDVVAQLGAGGAFEGFRHATSSDLGTFFANLGLTPGGLVADSGAAYMAAEALLGRTVLVGGTVGVFDDGGSASTVDQAKIFSSLLPPGSRSSIGGSPRSSTARSSSVGHWLVREAAHSPEPAGVLVWGGLALAAGAFVYKKKSRSSKIAA
jgi:hypothetical protein